jgi:hypothetical protein
LEQNFWNNHLKTREGSDKMAQLLMENKELARVGGVSIDAIKRWVKKPDCPIIQVIDKTGRPVNAADEDKFTQWVSDRRVKQAEDGDEQG